MPLWSSTTPASGLRERSLFIAMTEETIPPLKTAIAIDGRPMEGKQDTRDTTKDKLLRKVKEEKEQEGRRRAKKVGGERERQEGEEHRRGHRRETQRVHVTTMRD